MLCSVVSSPDLPVFCRAESLPLFGEKIRRRKNRKRKNRVPSVPSAAAGRAGDSVCHVSQLHLGKSPAAGNGRVLFCLFIIQHLVVLDVRSKMIYSFHHVLRGLPHIFTHHVLRGLSHMCSKMMMIYSFHHVLVRGLPHTHHTRSKMIY